MQKLIRVGRDLIENGEDFVLAKVVETVGSTPRKRNAWMLMDKNKNFYGTVGGGKLEAEVQKYCEKVLLSKESDVYDFSLTPLEKQGIDMQCGGNASVSIEYIDHQQTKNFGCEWRGNQKACIFGGGHVGKEVEKVLSYIGFNTIILDDREEFANRERFPMAQQVRLLKGFYSAFDEISCNEDTYLVIVTRGHIWDYEVLKAALKQPSAYIGMIGSKEKNRTIFEKLLQEGFSQKDLDRVHAPIGLSIGAETPEEIAISIAGEIIKVRAGYEQ